MRAIEVSKVIKVPDDVEAILEGRKITIKGPKGTLTRDLSKAPVSIAMNGKNIKIWATWPSKRESAMVGTVYAHINNMIVGVREGFTYKLKIVFSHFPISVKVDEKNKTILIENFTGERAPRKAKIIGDAKVKVVGDDVIVQGINIEEVSQTAANIEQATKIKKKDPRIFLDGIYLYERREGMD